MGLSTAAKVGIFCYVEWAIIHVAACGLIMINTLDNSSAKVGQMYVAVLGYFTAAGAGKYSVDELVLGGELQLYEGIIEKLKGGPMEAE